MPIKKTAESEKTTQIIKPRQLFRSTKDRMIGGVCGGIAEYFGWDAALVRLVFIFIILLGGSGVLAYLILWLILPQETVITDDQVVPTKDTLPTTESSRRPVWGVVLVGVGLVMLLQNYGYMHYLQLDKTWPIVLVIVGFLILSRAKSN